MASVAQALPCQDGAAQTSGEVGWISLKDERFRERFQKTLLNEPTRDLEAGWQLAWELGRPAVPLLWDMLAKEKAMVERRLIVLAAAVLAGGPIEDERLFAWLEQPKPMLEERVLGCMLMALGPEAAAARAGLLEQVFWPGEATRADPRDRVAPRIGAVSRGRGGRRTAPGRRSGPRRRAGVCVLAGLRPRCDEVVESQDARTPRRVVLARRAARWRAIGQRWHDATRRPGREEQEGDGARQRPGHGSPSCCGAVSRARRDFRTDAELDGSLLQLAAADPAKARLLQERLGPTPPPRLDEPQRLAVCYVMSRDPEVVIKDRAVWGAEERIRKHVATALAMRLLADQQPRTLDSLPAVPEWVIVRWAAGAPMEAVVLDDPPLQAAVELAAAGRLSRPVMRNLLEEALWRWGSHPGSARGRTNACCCAI
jgi:hypothetical protein